MGKMHVCYYRCTAMRYKRSAFRAFPGKKEGAPQDTPCFDLSSADISR